MVSYSVKVTVPKGLLKDVNVASAIAQAQRKYTAPDVLKMFYGTTDGWAHRPNFSSKQVVNTRRVSMTVGLLGTFGGSNKSYNIYKLVNAGSPRHKIPRGRGFVRYQKGYISATIPGQLFSHTPRRFGEFVSRSQFEHPGFEGRAFDAQIAKEYENTFQEDMQDAINGAMDGWGK